MSPGATDSSKHEIAIAPRHAKATPTAPSQPAGRPVSPRDFQGHTWWAGTVLGRGKELRLGEPFSESILQAAIPGSGRHVWPKAAQGPNDAAGQEDDEAGEQSEEDAGASPRPVWELKATRSGRIGSCSSGSGSEGRAERSPSPTNPRAQRTPEPRRSGGRQAGSPGKSASSHSTSHGRSGSQRSHSSGGKRRSASPRGQEVSSHMDGPELSGFQRSHRRRRCGPGRRALGAIMRQQRRFVGGWRHRRHRRGSRIRGRSSSAISEPMASGDEEIIGAAQPEASQDAPPALRAADASPQLRAPPGRARGVLLPRSTSPTPEAEAEANAEAEAIAPLWDSAIWEKSNTAWQRASDVQERHKQQMADRREQDRAAAEAKKAAAAVAEAQRLAARHPEFAVLAAGEARRAAYRKGMDTAVAAARSTTEALRAAGRVQPFAGIPQLGMHRPPTTQAPPNLPRPWFADHTQLGVQRAPNAQQAATRTQPSPQRAPIVQFPAFRTQLWAQGQPRAATRPQMAAQRAPAVQRHNEWDALMAAACDAGGATPPVRSDAEAPKFNFRPSRPLAAAAGPSTTFRAGGGPGLFVWPTQNNSTPHTESLIDLTASDPEASPCCSE